VLEGWSMAAKRSVRAALVWCGGGHAGRMWIGFGHHTELVIRGGVVGVDCSLPDSGHLIARWGIER